MFWKKEQKRLEKTFLEAGFNCWFRNLTVFLQLTLLNWAKPLLALVTHSAQEGLPSVKGSEGISQLILHIFICVILMAVKLIFKI